LGDFELDCADDLQILTLLSTSGEKPYTASLKFLPEDQSLAVILSSGDITVLSLAEGEYKEEVVGCVEGGVRAAEWSPDDEQVVLVTGEYGSKD
jgi:hypothetical protein